MFKFLKNPGAQLVCSISVRNFSESFVKLQKAPSNLGALRKSTGYALSKCKIALEKHDGNVEEAAKWLNQEAQKEGWAKADKVKDRATGQGTLIFVNDRSSHKASILEMNCETDFVARSEKFMNISSLLAMSVIKNAPFSSGKKQILYKDELNKLGFINDSTSTIADQMALAIGNLGENMSVRRAVVFNIEPGQHLSWYMHGSTAQPVNQCHFGKYGALVNMSFKDPNANYASFDIGRQICQHIVGLKPVTIGELPESSVETEQDSPDAQKPANISDDENRLLYQEFLMKQNVTVLEFLAENNAVINEFIRFECGEFDSDEPNV